MDPRRSALVASAAVFVASVTTGCDHQSTEPPVYSYCVDNNTGMIVDGSHCGCPDDDYTAVDQNGNPVNDPDDDDDITYRCRSHPYPYVYSYWVTHDEHKKGYKLKPTEFAKRINPGDPKARVKAGLSPKGTVKNGTQVSGGGMGKGKSGSNSGGKAGTSKGG